MANTFANIVDEVHSLDVESKVELLKLLRSWLVEERREEIFKNAEKSLQEYKEGKANSGSIDDLVRDLHGED